ncbi:uncharacterized protein BJX67DRAFT_361635 [Aspergillus lucknowensis]|uniref:Uncharacterized protein n=1 Tax=Aspergillus lucknowensis TaxID=176173 RepID=A0ABR4LI67_9EURO
MLNEAITINEVMQASYDHAKDNAAGMENAARRLQCGLDESRQDVVRAFTQGRRDLTAGLIHWSYSGQCSFKAAELDADRVLSFRINRDVRRAAATGGSVAVHG